MALNQRRTKILEMVQEDGHVKVQELSRIFGVSDVTIRQDLEVLETLGYVQREYGGAYLKEVGLFAKTGKMVWGQENIEMKKSIAVCAARMINDDDVVILDSGSTTTEIAKLLVQQRRRLTVITNGLNIAFILGENPSINLIVTGGEFKAPTLSLTGEMAAKTIENIHANMLFLATAGISSDMNLTYPSLSDLVVKKAMINCSDKIYLVADSTKIGKSAFASLGSVSMVDCLITNNNVTADAIQSFNDCGVEVITD